MVKAVNAIRNTLLAVTVFLLAALVYGFYTVPDEIVSANEKPANLSYIYTLTYEENQSVRKNMKKGLSDTDRKSVV